MTTVAFKALPDVYRKQQENTIKRVAKGLRSGARAGRAHLVMVTLKDRGMAKMAWKEHDGPAIPRSPTPAAWVDNSCPYIGILEKGSRPHKVSIEGQRSIYEWVERHFRIAGGVVLSTSSMGEGIKSDSLTNIKSRAHKVQRMDYLGKLSRLGAILENTLVRNFPDMGRRLVPAALNITASIIEKIRKHGSKPHYFVRDSIDLLTRIAQGEVERCLREGGAK